MGPVMSSPPVIRHAAEFTLLSVVGAEDAVRGTVISSDDGHRACNGFTSSTSRRRDFGQWACSAHLRVVFLLIKLAPRSASLTRVCT
jgi:hypothetical protein